MIFCASMSMPAEYWPVRTRTTCHILHACAEIPSHPYHSLLFIPTWGGMCLDSPGPSRTILPQLGVLACVLGLCLQALFQFRPLSFSQRIYLSFYSNMALVLFCTMARARGGTAVLFLSRKVAARLSEWACSSRSSCEAEQWKCCKREEKKQLEALGW